DVVKNKYIYNYTDHLGNVRLSYTKGASGGAEIIEENNYYPFGLKHQGYNSNSLANNAYQYKYQGQELQENGWYSFKWRNYIPELGRFFNVDPLAEKFPYNSIYAFSENRVIDGRELEGLEVVLLNNNNHNKSIIDVAKNGKYADDSKTKTIHVFAHGNPYFIINENDGGRFSTGKVLNQILNKHSSLWKNTENKDGFTIVLHSCRTGRCTTNKEGKERESVAGKISGSKEMKGIKIIAPDERDFFDGSKEIGPRAVKNTDKNGEYDEGIPDKKKGVQTGEGNWNVFENGKKTNQYDGSWTPKANPSVFDNFLHQK
ncbi:RHS repeat-associated core domain-containing protein, partial [Elizabethkingia sp. HX YK]